MSEKKIAVLGGANICATEVDALIARMYFYKKFRKRSKAERKRDKANRWR